MWEQNDEQIKYFDFSLVLLLIIYLVIVAVVLSLMKVIKMNRVYQATLNGFYDYCYEYSLTIIK